MKYADKVKTPTLFIHSEEDYRCWLAEGIQMFTALKYHGVEARLCCSEERIMNFQEVENQNIE